MLSSKTDKLNIVDDAFCTLDEENFCTLDQVEPGQTVQVCKLEQINPKLCCKLNAMGIVTGCPITVVGRAPLGCPISISARGYQLSLRRTEARSVEVVSV